MGHLKRDYGTSLGGLGWVDSRTELRLRAASITTVEELRSLISADPVAAGSFLGQDTVGDLRNRMIAEPPAAGALAIDSDMTLPERFLGALPPAGREVEARVSEETFDAYAPSALAGIPADAREGVVADVRDLLGPVREQGSRYTCVAHAVLAAYEAMAGREFDGSEQFLYWAAKEQDGHKDERGTWIWVAMKVLAELGVSSEATWPYVPEPVLENEGQGPPPMPSMEEAYKNRAIGTDVGRSALEAICARLDAGKPVALSVPVYPNWFMETVEAFGFIPMPIPGSESKGGHAMCAVGYGYDDELPGGGFLIVRNSWGTDWAAQGPLGPGHGALPFTYVQSFGYEAWTCESV